MKKSHLAPILLTLLAVGIIVSIFIGNQNYLQLKKYMDASNLINQKKFSEARAEFEALGDFKNSKNKIIESYYEEGKYLLGEREFDAAREAFTKAGEYKDSAKKIKDVSMAEAKSLLKNEKFTEAANLYGKLGEHEESQKALFKYAKYLIEHEDFDNAREVLKSIEGYEGADELLKSIEPTPTETQEPEEKTLEPDEKINAFIYSHTMA